MILCWVVRRPLQCIFILFFPVRFPNIEKMIITLPMTKYHESNKSVHFEGSFRFSLTLYFRRIKKKRNGMCKYARFSLRILQLRDI